MSSFFDFIKSNPGLLKQSGPLTDESNQQKGYVPANQASPRKQYASFDPNSSVLPSLINEYNKAKDWDRREQVVNSMMENFPNADEQLLNWIKRLDNVTQRGRKESEMITWATRQFISAPSIDKKEQIVNYLMENNPNPSKWMRSKIMSLDNLAKQLRSYQDNIGEGVDINSLGEYK